MREPFSSAIAASPQLSAFLLGLLLFIALLSLLALAIDARSQRLFHGSLLADRDLRALARCQAAAGHAVIFDRRLDPPQAELARIIQKVPQEEEEEAEAAQAAALPQLAGAPSMLHPVLRHSFPPQEGVLFKEHSPSSEEARARAWLALPSHGACCSRALSLRWFLLRYTLLRVYFQHPLAAPFTSFSAQAGRVNRLAAALAALLLSYWADAALASLKSGSVGDGAQGQSGAAAADAALPLLVCTLISIPAQQLALALLQRAIACADGASFRARYPVLALEAARREAAERQLALLSAAELRAALKGAPAARAAGAGAGAAAAPAAASAAPALALPAPSLLVLSPPDSLLVRSAAEPHLQQPEAPPPRKQLPQSLAWVEAPEGAGEEEEEGEEGERGAGEPQAQPDSAAASAPAPAAEGSQAAPAPAPAQAWWRLGACCARPSAAAAQAKERAAAAAAAAAALEAVTARMAALVAAEAEAGAEAAAAAAAAAAGGGAGGCCARWRAGGARALARQLARWLLAPQTALAALLLLLLGLFTWYALLFALVQGDAVAAAFTRNWLSSQATNLLLIAPAVKGLEALATFVVWPCLAGLLRSGREGAGAGAAADDAAADASSERDRALMLMRAAGLASALPPALAFLAYGLTLASSTASSAVGGRVARALAAAAQPEESAALDRAVAAARARAPRLSRRARQRLVVRAHVQQQEEATAAAAAAATASSDVSLQVSASPPQPPPPPPPPSGRHLHALNLSPLATQAEDSRTD